MDNINALTEYVDRLYALAVSKAHDSFAAEDIAQESLLAAFEALSRGITPDALWPWLAKILSNKYCDYLRAKYNRPHISLDSYNADISADDSIFTGCEYMEQLELVKRELGFLAKTHREVMVRFYIHGESVSQIASELGLPVGTVKSRLNTGRQHIRKGVDKMENYTKQSYEPDILHISASGEMGINNEPFSLVPPSDRLTQNILILAYDKPVSESDIAKALGVPAAFVEPVVEKMINGELMKRTGGGKVYTDFIIYTEKDRKATLNGQLKTAEEHFDVFWGETGRALEQLRGKEYYKRQPPHAKAKLELHFCVKLLMNAHIAVRNEITGKMSYSDYPYRKDGGRWFAMGQLYEAGSELNAPAVNYSVSGEASCELRNFRDTKNIWLKNYGTGLGDFPHSYFKAEYLKWLYEIHAGVAWENSSAAGYVVESADSLIKSGILDKNGAVGLDIPVLSYDEYSDECSLCGEYTKLLSQNIRAVMLPLFEHGYVKLPQHLNSVPKWQQYMYCGDSVPMAVICKAKENRLFLDGCNYPLPAAIIVVK